MGRRKGPTKWAHRVLVHMRKGQTLCREYTSAGTRYWLEPSGREVTSRTAQEVMGYAEPWSFGLFGDPQTWRIP